VWQHLEERVMHCMGKDTKGALSTCVDVTPECLEPNVDHRSTSSFKGLQLTLDWSIGRVWHCTSTSLHVNPEI
jgi:hypothetical protein